MPTDDIDDRKTAMAQANLETSIGCLRQGIAGTIRPAMGHQVSNAGKGLGVLSILETESPTQDPTHLNLRSFPLCATLLHDHSDASLKGIVDQRSLANLVTPKGT